MAVENQISIKITIENKRYTFDGNSPIPISVPIKVNEHVNAWNAPNLSIKSLTKENTVRFNQIEIVPHSHCTHTECLGHISKEDYHINTLVKKYFNLAKLISVKPEKEGEDLIITKEQIKSQIDEETGLEALIIRTLPNTFEKLTKNYTHTNPAYFTKEAAEYIREKNILHWLVDLPSVDKEYDNGVLAAHHAFWNIPDNPMKKATITEFVFIDNSILDGIYALDLQIAPIANNATLSNPVLYPLANVEL